MFPRKTGPGVSRCGLKGQNDFEDSVLSLRPKDVPPRRSQRMKMEDAKPSNTPSGPKRKNAQRSSGDPPAPKKSLGVGSSRAEAPSRGHSPFLLTGIVLLGLSVGIGGVFLVM